MCSRRVDTAKGPIQTAATVTVLSRAPSGQPLHVIRVMRPAKLEDRVWHMSLLRLEELGIFPGQVVENLGSAGQFGALILRAGGSRVALSRDLAEAVLVRY